MTKDDDSRSPDQAEQIEVRGPVVDEHTRCTHYAGPLDVIAIRFYCCGRWYPCLQCHDSHESHSIRPWPTTRRQAEALLCGACRHRMSIAVYLRTESCPACAAPFNPGCAAHHSVYFSL